MRTLGVVILQIVRDTALPRFQAPAQAGQALILKGAIKALQMGVVIRGPHPAMTMKESLAEYPFGKAGRKLTAVIRLDGADGKRGLFSSPLKKGDTLEGISPHVWPGKGPASADIEECIDIEAGRSEAIPDGINFHQGPRFYGAGPRGILMPLLVFLKTLQVMPPNDPLH